MYAWIAGRKYGIDIVSVPETIDSNFIADL
jgi:hypothetical protein